MFIFVPIAAAYFIPYYYAHAQHLSPASRLDAK